MQRAARQLCCRLLCGSSSQPPSSWAASQLQQQQPCPLPPALLQQLAPPPALLSSAHLQQHPQQQQHRAYAARGMNQKEQKRQNKTDKKALKKSAVPQSGAGGGSGGDSAAAFSDEVQAMEADVTRLVLQAIHNVMPVLDARTIRSATNVSYVPGLMPPRKARSLALHWLVKAADSRSAGSKASYAECLALELLLAYQKRGAARQKRDDLHKLALQNRANVHMRWW